MPSEKATIEQHVNQRISVVGERLSTCLRSLLREATAEPTAPRRLVKALGVHQVFSQKLVTALRNVDPLATMHLIPGPEPLRRLAAAARKKGVGATQLRDAEDAIDAFELLIREIGGDRSGLDAIISAWLPDVRARFENVAKQSVYRGMRQLKGIAADVVFFVTILQPSRNTDRLDIAALRGYLGLRCIRPGAKLRLGVRSTINSPPQEVRHMPLTFSGEPVHDLRGGIFIDSFCSDPGIALDFHEAGQDVVYSLSWGEEVGAGSARDIVIGELRRDTLRRHRGNDPDYGSNSGITNAIDVPSRTYVWDLLLHTDAYPDWSPNVRVLETGERGRAGANDRTRDQDQLDVLESIEPLGTDIQRFRAEEIPRHVELLQYALSQLGWDPTAFRGFRTRINYPIFSSQVQVVFPLTKGRN